MATDALYDLQRDGFTILKGVHPRERTRAAHALIQRVIAYAEKGLVDPYAPWYLRHRADQGALYDVVQRHPELHDFARNPRVLDTLATALGEDIFMYENSVVYKPRGKRNAVPYHQDFISRADEPLKLIAWSAMEPVTAATGAMWVFQGSHAGGFLPWHRVKGETHHDRIVPEALPTTPPVQVELEEGDVLIFNQMLVHGSDEVHADTPRIAVRVSYQGFGSIFVPRGTPLVVRGGSPEALARRFPAPYEAPRKPALWRRALRYVGRRLAAV
jgi:phytanoyl-CoA hydroxylase